MICLALDSSGKTLSLAISQGETLLAERFLNLGLTHSETLMPQLLSLLEDLNLEFSDIDLLAVCSGPGSYTGIRIGLSTMKSLSWLLDIPLYSFTSLEILSSRYGIAELFVLGLIDARGGRVFSALYKGTKTILPIANRQAADLILELKDIYYLGRSEKPVIYLSGDGTNSFLEAYEADSEASKHFDLKILSSDLSSIRAGDLARLAFDSYLDGERPDWSEAEAVYASPTQAERVRQEELKKIMIRPASPEDIEAIHMIERATFPTPWSRKSLLHQLDPENKITRLFLVSKKDDQGQDEPLGYGGYTIHYDEAEILNIAMLDHARRQGAGRKLLERVMQDAISRGANKISLEVRESNEPAQNLYYSMGFKPVGVRRNYYDKPREDALILMWAADKSN